MRHRFLLFFFLLLPATLLAAEISFDPAVRQDFIAGNRPSSLAVGDFNADGRPDLAVANSGSSSVSILRGNGEGTFAAAVNYRVGTNPVSIAIGDLNADGNPDLVVVNYGSNSISMLRGNGDGTFQDAVNYAEVNTPYAVTIGDLNADGRPDLAVVNGNSSSVSILRGNGDGTFQAAVNYGVGTNPRSIAIGDLNADGRLDLAVANSGGNTISFLRGNGDGTFQAKVSYGVGTNPRSIVIGDLNADGRPDLAVANSGSNNISMLRGNGDGTFQAAVNYGVGTNPSSIAIGDLNADGRPDLAVVNSGDTTLSYGNTVSILRGNGNGTFQAAVNYFVGDTPNSVIIEDFNGDSRSDLAVANSGANTVSGGNTVSILRGNGDSTFQVAVNYGAGDIPTSVAIGDINGDGRPDLAVANLVSNNVSILRGNGDGTFQAAVNYGVGTSPISVAIGDLNGDGWPDLAVANNSSNNNYSSTVSILKGKGDGTFWSAVNYGAGGVGTSARSVAIGDVNGDGRPDLAVANSVNVSILRGNGNGTFQAAVNYDAGTGPLSVAIGDLNADGRPDLAVANNGSNSVSILRGNGNGTFQAAVNYDAGTGPFFVTIGDLNADGRPDLAVANHDSSSVSILRGNGDGTFAAAVNYGVGTYSRSIAIGDLNADGRPDLAVVNYGSNSISMLRGNGDGTFQAAVNYGAGANVISVAIGDLNADGRPDLAVANQKSNNVSILQNDVDLPAWSATYPQIGTIDSTSVEVLVNADHGGAAYLVCLPSGAVAPTSTQIRAGQNAAGSALAANLTDSDALLANSTMTLSCTALTPAIAYDLYTVAADIDGSLQAQPTKLTIMTLYPDTDGDGVNDDSDAFPFLASEFVDTDDDGIGNNADTDDDGDDIPDLTEIANGTDPLNPDTTVPTLTLSMLSDNAHTNNAALNVSGTATDNTALLKLLLNSEPVTVQPDGSFSTVLGLLTGDNSITVTANDLAGNKTVQTRTIILDKNAPQISIATPADNTITARSSSFFSGTVDESADLQIIDEAGAIHLPNRDGNAFTADIQLAEGLNTLTVNALDLAGNSGSAKRTVTYDPLAPNLSVITPAEDTIVRDGLVTISGLVTDSLSEVTLTVTADGKSYTPTADNTGHFSQEIVLPEEGTYPVQVTATDEAGNSSSVTRNIISAFYPKIGAVTATTVEVLANIDQDGSASLVCRPIGSIPPTSLQVLAGQDANSIPLPANFTASAALLANNTTSLSCTTLTPYTSYDLYVVTTDSAGVLPATPTKLTLARKAPEATLTTNVPSPQLVGATVTLTAAATGSDAGPYEYRFWWRSTVAGSTWAVGQNYSTSPTWSWNTASLGLAAGSYFIQVDTRHVGNTAKNEAIISLTYKLVDPAPPSDVTLTSNIATPQLVGSTVIFTAKAIGGDARPYEYRFWWRSTLAGSKWAVGQNYSSSTTWSWNSTSLGLPAGSYYIQVDTRHVGNTARSEMIKSLTYKLVVPIIPATGVLVTTNVSTPQPAGTTITFTGQATGGDAGPYEYRFWWRPTTTGATWTVGQAYATSSTWDWNTTTLGLPAGSYYIQVDTRHIGSTIKSEKIKSMPYVLN